MRESKPRLTLSSTLSTTLSTTLLTTKSKTQGSALLASQSDSKSALSEASRSLLKPVEAIWRRIEPYGLLVLWWCQKAGMGYDKKLRREFSDKLYKIAL